MSVPLSAVPVELTGGAPADHFTIHEGVECAGRHLLVDMWGASHLADAERMRSALCEAALAGGATVLHVHLHRFTPSGGLSGVVVLAESHISVHSWPERGFVAFDVFMCGDTRPERSVAVLERHFRPARCEVRTCLRGVPGSDD